MKWSLEEYTATFGDDDLQFVGTLDENGLFTPNVDGPNPKRSGNRNNVGDVWVVAELIGSRSRDAGRRPLRARAHLLVTVPLYMAWFETEGGQMTASGPRANIIASRRRGSRSSTWSRAPRSSRSTTRRTPCCGR